MLDDGLRQDARPGFKKLHSERILLVAMTACDSLISAILCEYGPVPAPLLFLTQMPLVASLAAWAVFAVIAAGIPFTLKSSRAQVMGFGIATIGAMLICVSSTYNTQTAKQELATLHKQIVALDNKPDETKRIKLEADVGEQERLTDLAGLMSNFAIMTLGGFGAGMLAAVATTTRTRKEDEALDAPVFEKMLHVLRCFFCYVGLSSTLTGLVLYHPVGVKWIASPPYPSSFHVACSSLVMVVLLAAVGYCATHACSRLEPKRPLAPVIVGIIVAYIYLKGMSLAAGVLGDWVWMNAPLLLLFRDVRQRLNVRRLVTWGSGVLCRRWK